MEEGGNMLRSDWEMRKRRYSFHISGHWRARPLLRTSSRGWGGWPTESAHASRTAAQRMEGKREGGMVMSACQGCGRGVWVSKGPKGPALVGQSFPCLPTGWV